MMMKSNRLNHLQHATYDKDEVDRIISLVSKAIEKYDAYQLENPDFLVHNIVHWILLTRSYAMTHHTTGKAGCDTMK
jgi:hypothetical protein